VNELESMLVPFDILSLPVAVEASMLGTLGLLIGIPLLVILVVFGLAYLGGPSEGSPKPADEPDEPLWLGERAPRALERGLRTETVGRGAEGSSETGGTSARW
jgi:hypothetical protein